MFTTNSALGTTARGVRSPLQKSDVEGKNQQRNFSYESGKHVGSLCVLSDKLRDCCIQDSRVTLRCGHCLSLVELVEFVTTCQYRMYM